jgi:hypothetical protein
MNQVWEDRFLDFLVFSKEYGHQVGDSKCVCGTPMSLVCVSHLFIYVLFLPPLACAQNVHG